jgi:hypothetical protein
MKNLRNFKFQEKKIKKRKQAQICKLECPAGKESGRDGFAHKQK